MHASDFDDFWMVMDEVFPGRWRQKEIRLVGVVVPPPPGGYEPPPPPDTPPPPSFDAGDMGSWNFAAPHSEVAMAKSSPSMHHHDPYLNAVWESFLEFWMATERGCQPSCVHLMQQQLRDEEMKFKRMQKQEKKAVRRSTYVQPMYQKHPRVSGQRKNRKAALLNTR